MYKGTHRNLQRRSDGLTPKNLMSGDQDLTPEQMRQNLVAAKKRVVEELASLPKGSPRRRELGAKGKALDDQINAIRAKRKGPRSVESHFISVAKEMLTRFQYGQIMDEATRRAEAEEARAAEGAGGS